MPASSHMHVRIQVEVEGPGLHGRRVFIRSKQFMAANASEVDRDQLADFLLDILQAGFPIHPWPMIERMHHVSQALAERQETP